VTEALTFSGKLYTTLGAAAPDAKISARFTHSGLAGRTLKSASSNRQLSDDRKSHDTLSETETVIVLGDIKSALIDEVRRVCANRPPVQRHWPRSASCPTRRQATIRGVGRAGLAVGG
jgi:hypothetical protein